MKVIFCIFLAIALYVACGIGNSDGKYYEPIEFDEKSTVILYDDTIHSFCVATVIGKEVLLTAAHCLVSHHTYYVKRYKEDPNFIWVKSTTVSPRYTGDTKKGNDIGLVYLERPIDAPIATYITDMYFEVGDEISAYGRSSGSLKRYDTTITTFSDDLIMSPSVTCNGDSGGPLVYNGYVIGVISFGDESCIYYSVYSRLKEEHVN